MKQLPPKVNKSETSAMALSLEGCGAHFIFGRKTKMKMKRHFILSAFIFASVALLITLLPQSRTAEEASLPTKAPTVSEALVASEKPPVEMLSQPMSKPTPATASDPIIEPDPMPTEAEILPTKTPSQQPAAESIQDAASVSTELPEAQHTGEFYYCPGFGWLESLGAGERIIDDAIYENGNKIGIMN